MYYRIVFESVRGNNLGNLGEIVDGVFLQTIKTASTEFYDFLHKS